VCRKHLHLHTLHNVISNVYQRIPRNIFDIYVRARMPERIRHTSSSHRHEPSSFRNNGIYIVGDTKIVVQNSGSMGCDVLLTPGSEKGGRLNTGLFLLRHPRQCLSQLRHHMQEDGTLLTCGYGTEMIEPSDVPHERRPHETSANGCHCSNNGTEDGRSGTGDHETRRASRHGHISRSSRRRRGRSSPASTQRHHDEVPALPAPHLGTICAPAIIQEVHVMNGDLRRSTPAEQQSYSLSRKSNNRPSRAAHSHAPIREHPAVQDRFEDASPDQVHGPARSRLDAPSSASETIRGTESTIVSSTRGLHKGFDGHAGDSAPPQTVRDGTHRRHKRRVKSEIPPSLGKMQQSKSKRTGGLRGMINFVEELMR